MTSNYLKPHRFLICIFLASFSFSAELKIQTTWVTDLVCMPDVSVICTASAERDLRFYDTTAQKFELRVTITSLPNACCALSYCFYEDININSKLILGDMKGAVKILEFTSKDRGPFKSRLGIPLIATRWEQFMKVDQTFWLLCILNCIFVVLGINSFNNLQGILSISY